MSTLTTSQLSVEKRTDHNEEKACVHPLDTARQRAGGHAIELSDSSDSTRRVPPKPSTSNGPRPGVLAIKDDATIITSSSEDDRTPGDQSDPVAKSRMQGKGANRKGPPAPRDVEVISILDSDDDVGTRNAGLSCPTVTALTSRVNLPLPPPPPPQPTTTPGPISESTAPSVPLVSTSTQLPQHPPHDTQRPGNEPTTQPNPPSYAPPPDDFDDAIGNMDFDAPHDNASGALDGWDGLDVRPSLAETLPAPVSSDHMGAGAASANTSMAEEGEDVARPGSLFDLYVNMDRLGADEDQRTGKDVLTGGNDKVEDRVMEDGVTNGQASPMRGLPIMTLTEVWKGGCQRESCHYRLARWLWLVLLLHLLVRFLTEDLPIL